MSLQMDISFACECGEHVEDIVNVQDPDFSAEKNKDSQTDSWQEVFCPSCDKEYTVQVTNTFYSAMASIDYGDVDVNYGMPYYPEDEADELYWYIDSKTHHEILQSHLKSVRTLLEVEVPPDTLFSLWVMLHGHVVSAIEGYLAGTFIHKVTNSEELIRKLVETDPEFSKRTFTLKEIFEKQSNLKVTVATYLKDLIFHDLKKVKPMFKDVLGHDFGDISWLFKDVVKRHDCVHRAGYNKDGEAIEVSKDSVLELLEKVEALANSVEATVGKLDEPDDLPF
ncbi:MULTISPECIES: hypothetical protein [unclassified Pseudoalteromonas]|mgnify:CR=1 FL=1|uniref:hypothetical protein n=1 Tax=unclassified Pseudoalteromonas TaxID=194690 RepID=UPI0013FE48BE|nr:MULTISPECIES: hypothetical protein [unclassified Pseudoalteromonas]MDN3403251.1 hypothetical protein [Pseudoalteromonas sp. APC 3213]|tara:strand:+ start:1326 stop:2168 length:843 start_codon:yes stop_codon:yes gene_type:complete